MKILIVGEGGADIHEAAVADACRKLGHAVETFYWKRYFGQGSAIARQWLRAQNKFIWGPRIAKLNRDILAAAAAAAPDLIFVYRGTHVAASTIAELKRRLPGCKVLGYNNDDPFSPRHPPWLWRRFIAAIPEYDMVFAYRRHNIDEFLRAGAKRADLLMPWFIPERDRPVAPGGGGGGFLYDVVFVGHYENDHRLDYLEALADSGINFRLFGPDWERAPKAAWLARLGPVAPVRGEDYTRALCSARIALCFFSRLNRDTYTRRCFEIPATRTMMLCEFSDDAASLFKEGEEAEFFKSPGEMLSKIRLYLGNDTLRAAVAERGFNRVRRDRHDVVSRIGQMLEQAAGRSDAGRQTPPPAQGGAPFPD